MKHNKLTTGRNLLWESSRMMLPEHREALLQQAQESKKLMKPELDEQELEKINRIIYEAFISKVILRLIIFNEYGNKLFIGRVTRIDYKWQRLLLVKNEESKWISFQGILDAIIE